MCKNLFFSLSLAVLLTAPAVLHAQQRAVSVSGFCYLEGQTDHSGSKVLFTAVSPSAVTDSVFTAFDGAFTAGLNEGIYTIEYSKTGYVTQTLPGTWSFFENDTLPDVTLLEGFSGTLEVSGPQSGVWESGYLVKAMGDLTVAAGDTLLIEPGVTVQFMGYYKLEVFGTLLAAGAEEDSIVFTSGQPFPAPDDWQTIYFQNATSSGSVVSYASIQYGQYGIYCKNSSSPTIQQNQISYNNDYGIYCYSSSPTIQQNQISYNNDDGIYCYSSSPTIQQNQISYNNDYGIYCYSSSP
ncbi:MAG TPA: right-handed parallel beta-helix repeat-containing protein, partial [Bacteroidales bacterium]|nr:right-handed parallel beta-helix repeat-containing protein [Bacteroidales bacterium]